MCYVFGEWELDIERYELRRADQPIKLEPQVFSVLAYLVKHHDRVLSKQELLSHLWPGQFIGDSALERCIMAARKAVGDSGGKQRVIKTFHRRGYRFVVPVIKRLEPSPTATAERLSPLARQPNERPESGHAVAPLSVADVAGGHPLSSEVNPEPGTRPVPSHRQVTVLSCAIANAQGLRTDASESLQSYLKPLFDHIAAHMQRHGGMMALSHDDGLLALFGASIPCEDHALWAVKAAMGLQVSLEQTRFDIDVLPMPLKFRMGLHTGDMIGKRFGDEPQMIYMAIGDTLQFATNLQACALPGTILASESTYRLVQHAVCGEVAGLVALQSGLRHTAAYTLSHVFTPSEISPSTSQPMLTAMD